MGGEDACVRGAQYFQAYEVVSRNVWEVGIKVRRASSVQVLFTFLYSTFKPIMQNKFTSNISLLSVWSILIVLFFKD